MDHSAPGGLFSIAGFSLAGIAAIGTCVLFAAIGVWHARRNSRRQNLDDYLTARASIGTGVSVATLVATLAGTWILASPPQIAFYFGAAGVVGYCVGQALPMFVYPLVGNRVRREYPLASTLSDAVGTRYGAPVRALVSLVGMFYMGVYLSVELTTIAQNLQVVAHWDLLGGAILVAVCTIAYAAWGGVRTAIFADRIQVGLIVVLLAVITVLVWQGLAGKPLAGVRAAQPELLEFSSAGWEMAGCLIIGIVASNLFDNSFWARIFACRNEAVVRRSFTLAGISIGLLLIPASLFGWWAIGNANVDNTNVLPFALVQKVCAPWAAIAILILALILAMSTLSALFNGIVGVLIADARALGAAGDARTLRWARLATALLAVPAVWIASWGRDATYLFFVANLVCAALVVPVFLGLWAKRLSGGLVFTAFVLALIPGVLWFPGDINGTPWLDIPHLTGLGPMFGQRLITSLLLALGVSSAIAITGAVVGRQRPVS